MDYNKISKLLNKKYPKVKFKFDTSKSGIESIIWLSDEHPSETEIIELINTPILSDGNENWDLLLSSLFGTEIFNKAYAASKRTIAANAAFTMLMNVLINIRNVDTLKFAFGELIEAMETKSIPPFEPAELNQLHQLLSDANFDSNMIMGELNNG